MVRFSGFARKTNQIPFLRAKRSAKNKPPFLLLHERSERKGVC
ncbi:MAG: hypothetical protein U5L45_13860 [Saprospiraceae bacterium]|nr:hypothetical protein [Saprospiraceae bacterium]